MQSIRGRIMVLFFVSFVFGGILSVIHVMNMWDLKRKMTMIDDFNTLLNSVLELRRYEKNFFYYKDDASIHEWSDYLVKVESLYRQHESEIAYVAGRMACRRFAMTLKEYSKTMRSYFLIKDMEVPDKYISSVREQGKFLVEFAQNLIRLKHTHINRSLNWMLAWPVLYFIIFLVLTLFIYQLINKSILRPLYRIRKAIAQVGGEGFEPIQVDSRQKDEITKLIVAFNRMAEQLETRQEQLIQSRKLASIGTFTSGIAHELNNPLNNISLTAESLLFGYKEMDEAELREHCEEIIAQADRASQVVKNLLEFSRIEQPFMRRLNISEVLDKSIRLIKNQLVIQGIHLEKKIDPDLPPVKGKMQQLENAFVNIILNAIQAIPGRGGTIRVETARTANGYIRIDISDTGVGIKPSDLEHIFDPFFTTKEVGKGTGLGLSLVYGIIRSHGGYIEVSSKVKVGTTFSIFLPIDKEEASENG